MPTEDPKATGTTQIVVALIGAGAVIIAALIGYAATRGGSSGPSGSASSSPSTTTPVSSNSTSGVPAVSASSTLVAQQPKKPITVTYTVDPTQSAPLPVPGLMLTRGDVITIKAISGQWICATVAGPAGIQGNTQYVATYHAWAVPSAPFCSLIGKIGNGPWQEMGEPATFVADRSGSLALTVNELMPDYCSQPPSNTSCYTDNEGKVKILITVN